jgi:hypothetical protein
MLLNEIFCKKNAGRSLTHHVFIWSRLYCVKCNMIINTSTGSRKDQCACIIPVDVGHHSTVYAQCLTLVH